MNTDNDSLTFRPVTTELNIIAGFSEPQLISETSASLLFRIKNMGKYFILKTPKQVNSMTIDILKREYEIGLRLNHYNIINAITFMPDSPVGPAILMEYVDGRNLHAFLAEQPSKRAKERVAEQIIGAIAYVHRMNIIHNDIKPENILVSKANDDVKLIDFGLSDNDAFYVNKHLGGTPRYASPELLAQADDIDTRSDIYSLGMVLHDITKSHYAAIWRRCIRTDRAARYRDADALLTAWQHRRRPQHMAVAAIAAAAVIGAGWWYFSAVNGRNAASQAMVEALQDSLSAAKADNARATATLDSVTAVLDSVAVRQQSQQQLYPAIKQQVDAIFDRYKADITAIAQRERINVIYANFALPKLNDLLQIKEIISDCALNADYKMQLQNHVDTRWKECADFQVAVSASLIDINTISNPQERQFYYNLAINGEHYRPFSPKGDD